MCVCTCVLSLGLPPSLFPISQCWDCSQPITARLGLTPGSPGLTLLCWVTPSGCSSLCDVQQQQTLGLVFFFLLLLTQVFSVGLIEKLCPKLLRKWNSNAFPFFPPGRREVPLPSLFSCCTQWGETAPWHLRHVSRWCCYTVDALPWRVHVFGRKEQWRVEVQQWSVRLARLPSGELCQTRLLSSSHQKPRADLSAQHHILLVVSWQSDRERRLVHLSKHLAPRLSPPGTLEMRKFLILI